MLVIPLQPVPSQTVSVNLNNQACTINVYQKAFGMFCDLLVNDTLIIGGVISHIGKKIVRTSYLGFSGDLVWFDLVSPPAVAPDYTGIGSRWPLYYLSAAEAADP